MGPDRRGGSFGIIGCGRIGLRVAQRLTGPDAAPRLVAVLVRPHQRDELTGRLDSRLFCTDLESFLARCPDVAVECASAPTLAAFGPALLAEGIDLMPLSLAAFANRGTEAALLAAARRGPGRIEIPGGAMGSVGILAAAREDGLTRVLFRAAYPPARWQGTPAADRAGAAALTRRRVVFRGSARQAAAAFPRHVNVSVAVALAGLGLDRTEVELVADPGITQAAFEFEAEAGPGAVRLTVSGRNTAVGEDPKDYTAFSVIRHLRRRGDAVVI